MLNMSFEKGGPVRPAPQATWVRQMLYNMGQTDVILIEFLKSFEKVPYLRLLFYGVHEVNNDGPAASLRTAHSN